MRQPQRADDRAGLEELTEALATGRSAESLGLTGPEEGIELLPELTRSFVLGQIPPEEVWSHPDFTQRVAEQVAVELVDRYQGRGEGKTDVEMKELRDALVRDGQEVQSEFARGEKIQIVHTAFEHKSLIRGVVGPGVKTGDPAGEVTHMISDMADSSRGLLLNEPGIGTYAVTGPGVTSLGRFPEGARALIVATRVNPARELLQEMYGRYNVTSVEELFDPQLPVEQLLHRIAQANEVEIGALDVTLIQEGQLEEVAALEQLKERHKELGLDLITGGTGHPAIPALLGQQSERGAKRRVPVLLRRVGITPALFKTFLGSVVANQGALVTFRVVSGQIRSGFNQRYDWDRDVETEVKRLRQEDAWAGRILRDDAEDILKGGKIFSNRQVKGRVRGVYTLQTEGSQAWSQSIPGARADGAGRYSVVSLSFQSPEDETSPGFVWATRALRTPPQRGLHLDIPGLLSRGSLGEAHGPLLDSVRSQPSSFMPLADRQRLGAIALRPRIPDFFLREEQKQSLRALLGALSQAEAGVVSVEGQVQAHAFQAADGTPAPVRRLAIRLVETEGPLFRTRSGRLAAALTGYEPATGELTLWLPKGLAEEYFSREDTRAVTQIVLFALWTDVLGLTEREALLALGSFYNADATLPVQGEVAIPDALRAVGETLHRWSLRSEAKAAEAAEGLGTLRAFFGRSFRWLTETEQQELQTRRGRSDEEVTSIRAMSGKLADLVQDWETALIRQFDRFLIVEQETLDHGYHRYRIAPTHREELDPLFGAPSHPRERYGILLKEGNPVALLREDPENFTLKARPYPGLRLESQGERDHYREALLAYAHLQTVQTGHLLLVYEERGDRIGLVLRDDERSYAVDPQVPGRKSLSFQLGDLEGQRRILGDPTQRASSERQFQLEFRMKDSKRRSMLVEIDPPDTTFGRGLAFLVVPKKTVLVVGYGTIGSKIARQLTRFGFDVVVANRGVDKARTARNHGFPLYFLQDYAIGDPTQREGELQIRQELFRNTGVPWNTGETLESLLRRGGVDLIVNAIDKNTQPFLKGLYSLNSKTPVILQGGDKSEWADVVFEPTVHEVLGVPFTPYRQQHRVFKCPSCNETFGSHLLAAAGLIPDLVSVSGHLFYMRRHADPYALKSDLTAEGPKIQLGSHHAPGIVEVFEAIPKEFSLPFKIARRTGRPDLTSTATTSPQTKAHQSIATLDLQRRDGGLVDLDTYNQALSAMGTIAAIGFGKEFEPGPILEVAVEQYGALHPFALHPVGTRLSADNIEAIGLTPQESNVVTGNLELIIALTGLVPDEDRWRFINGLVQHVQDIPSRKNALERVFPLKSAGHPLHSPPVWPPLSTRERFAQIRAGLEEDRLLAIWQRNKEMPAFQDPLETPRLLKEWDRFGPLVKKHLRNPNSPIPQFLLWEMLLSERWEAEMEKRDPSQWVWLADQLLPHWEGVGESSQGGQRLQELKLLAALDRLLLKQAHLLKQDQGNVDAEPLVDWHRRILAVWRQEFSRGDPHGLSEQLVVSFLRSLKEVAGLSPRRREPLWSLVEMQRTFEWIQKAWAQERRPAIWEASFLTPEHLPLLAELPRKEQAALLESVLPKLLYRSPKSYDSMGRLDQAAHFKDLWMAAESRPELKGAFLAGLAKSPVEKILDPLLEIAADYREVRTQILRFLAVLPNLKKWFFTDQNLPWVNLIYLMNQIETPEQHLWMQEVNRLLLKGYSGMIGVPRSSRLRPLTRPLENPDSFGPDLNGFIRRETHHVGGAHVLDLVLLRLHWWATGDKTPLVEYLKELNTVQARETQNWLENGGTMTPEEKELRPALQQILQKLSEKPSEPERDQAAKLLATVEEADLQSVREDLKEKGAWGLDRLFEREIPLVRLLWRTDAPRSAEAALEAIQNLHRNQQGIAGWPGEKLERFLTVFRGENRLAALQALAELHSAVRQEILRSSSNGASRYPKWSTSHREDYQREYEATSQVHHGIPAVRGYDPGNLNFQLYILLEYLKPLAGQWAGQLVRQAQQEQGWPDQARMLKGLLQWLKATGPGSQPLEDLLELAGSESITPARLQLIGKQLLIYLDQMVAHQDEQIGETIDAVALVLQEEQMNSEILEGMGLKTLPAGRIWEPRLRPHLERQILAHRQAAVAARTFATLLMGRFNQLGEEDLLKPVLAMPAESREAPRDWVSLTASVAESGGLDHLGNKFRNLMLLHQWGHPVPPAAGFPIGREAQEVVQRMSEGVKLVEAQIHDRGLQKELGARFADPENPLLLSVRSGALVDLPGQLATLENVGIYLGLLPALERRIGSWAAWDAYRRFVQDFAMSVYGSVPGIHRELFDQIIEGHKRKAGVEKKIQLSAEQMEKIALEYGQAVQSLVPGGIPEDPLKQLELAIQAVVGSWDQPTVQPIREIFGLAHEKGTAVILQAMVHGNFSRPVNGAEGHERSGAGVAFVSSDGDVPEKDFVGSFGQGAQGSDVAEGVIIPEPLSRLEELMPKVFEELQERARGIQERNGEEREIEFTIQDGRVWFLQDRSVPIRGWVPKFNRKTVEASVPLGGGEGLAGGAVRGILAFPTSLGDPARLDEFNRLSANRGADGIILAMDTAAPEDTHFLRMRGVIGFLAHRGGKGQHEGMIANSLGLAAVAGLSGMELDSDNPADGVDFHADPLKKDTGVHLEEGDLVSVDGLSGKVYRGRIPLATEPSDVPSAGLEEGAQGAPLSVVVADDMDETKLGVGGIINVSSLPKEEKIKEIVSLRPRRLVVRSATQVDRTLIDWLLPELTDVIRAGHGTENVDTAYALSKGVRVRKSEGAEDSMAALAARMVARARAIHQAHSETEIDKAPPALFTLQDWRQAVEEKMKEVPAEDRLLFEQKANELFQPISQETLDSLRGQTLGIIGFGAVGKRIAAVAQGLGMGVQVYAPSLEADPTPALQRGFRFATIEQIYRTSHYIIPITGFYKAGPRKNVGMIGKAAVEAMLQNKDLIALVNPDREGLVVEEAVRRLMAEGKAQYVVDEMPRDAYLREHAIYTNHIGASTTQAKGKVIANVAAILAELSAEAEQAASAGPSTELRTGLEENDWTRLSFTLYEDPNPGQDRRAVFHGFHPEGYQLWITLLESSGGSEKLGLRLTDSKGTPVSQADVVILRAGVVLDKILQVSPEIRNRIWDDKLGSFNFRDPETLQVLTGPALLESLAENKASTLELEAEEGLPSPDKVGLTITLQPNQDRSVLLFSTRGTDSQGWKPLGEVTLSNRVGRMAFSAPGAVVIDRESVFREKERAVEWVGQAQRDGAIGQTFETEEGSVTVIPLAQQTPLARLYLQQELEVPRNLPDSVRVIRIGSTKDHAQNTWTADPPQRGDVGIFSKQFISDSQRVPDWLPATGFRPPSLLVTKEIFRKLSAEVIAFYANWAASTGTVIPLNRVSSVSYVEVEGTAYAVLLSA